MIYIITVFEVYIDSILNMEACPQNCKIHLTLNKMKTNKIIEYVLSLPKSIYVSFRLVAFKDAVRVPVFVRYNCRLLSLKGSVKTGGGCPRTQIGHR